MGEKPTGDIEFEIRFYEGILKRKGDFLQALTAVGDLYTRQGLYDKGLEVDKKLAQLRPSDPIVLYNLACSYSLVNQIDKAYQAMKAAIECGYDDFPYLERDDDLKNLLSDRRFRRYYSRVKGKKTGAEAEKKLS